MSSCREPSGWRHRLSRLIQIPRDANGMSGCVGVRGLLSRDRGPAPAIRLGSPDLLNPASLASIMQINGSFSAEFNNIATRPTVSSRLNGVFF
jgi:hypothetical protein